ncbi:hypothetical protein F5883DRAFT_722697 [Diaporthe sp. PMI_573]|nr:hypothetical protein F5883DRAFT_722697 [Diaporthaceae sp. PMI_573]
MDVVTPLPKYEKQNAPGVLGSSLDVTVIAEIMDVETVLPDNQDVNYGSFSATIPFSFCPPTFIDQHYIHLLYDKSPGGMNVKVICYSPFDSGMPKINNEDDQWFQITGSFMPYSFPVQRASQIGLPPASMPLLLPKDRMFQPIAPRDASQLDELNGQDVENCPIQSPIASFCGPIDKTMFTIKPSPHWPIGQQNGYCFVRLSTYIQTPATGAKNAFYYMHHVLVFFPLRDAPWKYRCASWSKNSMLHDRDWLYVTGHIVGTLNPALLTTSPPNHDQMPIPVIIPHMWHHIGRDQLNGLPPPQSTSTGSAASVTTPSSRRIKSRRFDTPSSSQTANQPVSPSPAALSTPQTQRQVTPGATDSIDIPSSPTNQLVAESSQLEEQQDDIYNVSNPSSSTARASTATIQTGRRSRKGKERAEPSPEPENSIRKRRYKE